MTTQNIPTDEHILGPGKLRFNRLGTMFCMLSFPRRREFSNGPAYVKHETGFPPVRERWDSRVQRAYQSDAIIPGPSLATPEICNGLDPEIRQRSIAFHATDSIISFGCHFGLPVGVGDFMRIASYTGDVFLLSMAQHTVIGH